MAKDYTAYPPPLFSVGASAVITDDVQLFNRAPLGGMYNVITVSSALTSSVPIHITMTSYPASGNGVTVLSGSFNASNFSAPGYTIDSAGILWTP